MDVLPEWEFAELQGVFKIHSQAVDKDDDGEHWEAEVRRQLALRILERREQAELVEPVVSRWSFEDKFALGIALFITAFLIAQIVLRCVA